MVAEKCETGPYSVLKSPRKCEKESPMELELSYNFLINKKYAYLNPSLHFPPYRKLFTDLPLACSANLFVLYLL